MKKTLTILLILFLLSCNESDSSKLVYQRDYAKFKESVDEDELRMVSHNPGFNFDSSCAFVNEDGDTIIPFGRYRIWDAVNFISYAIVKDSSGIVGINRNGEIMFDAFVFGDFQIDQPSEGMFRVKRNGKIGFANLRGKVVIPCKYECAEPFLNGKAKVALNCLYSKDDIGHVKTESNEWFYIDKKGEKY